MNKVVDIITNDYYKVLLIIFDNQVTIGGETFCPLSQEKIATIAGVSRNTIGTTIKKLRQQGLIICKESETKKYFLSEETTNIIKKMKNIK